MTKAKPFRTRPLTEEEKLTTSIGAHVTRDEQERIRVAASLEHQTMSKWLRHVALRAADSVLDRRGVVV